MQLKTARLPVRPSPITGELTSSYLVRVAAANGYNDPRELIRALRKNDEVEMAERLASALLLCSSDLRTLFGPYPGYCGVSTNYAINLHVDDFNHQCFRWCPYCLSEAAYLRGEWGLKLCCVCPFHAVMLCDRCSKCGAPQRLERADLALCTCGYHLAAAKTIKVSEAMLRMHCLLYEAMPHSSHDHRSAIDIATWLRLVKYLGAFDLDPLAAHPGQITGLNQLPIAVALTGGAAHLLSDWPSNFEKLLRRIRSLLPDETHIGDAFGPLYRVLYRHLNHPALQFLQDEFERYLHNNWFGLLGRRNRRLTSNTIASHCRKPAALLAHEAGVPKSVLRQLAERGAIEAEAVHHRSGRITWAIPLQSAHQAAEFVLGHSTLASAAQRLGLPKRRIRELVKAGLIGTANILERAKQGPWLLSNADISKLAAPRFSIEPIGDPNDHYISLSTVLRSWRLHGLEFPDLMRSILSGGIVVHRQTSEDAGLRRVKFKVKELRAWLGRYRQGSEAWMSVAAAADTLGIKEQVAYELVKRSLLKATTNNERGAVRYRVHQDAIEEFRACYISLAEIATQQRKTPRTLLILISAPPICGPTIDGARQYFYSRGSIAGLFGKDDIICQQQ